MDDREEHGQPPEWEALLEDVTIPRDRHQVPFDPSVMETVLATYSDGYRQLLLHSPTTQVERWAELERLRAIAKRKLTGKTREAFLLFLTGEHSFRGIARALGMSKDAVRRHVTKAGALVKQHIERPAARRFPAAGRGSLKTAILPLDTDPERRAFIRFINDNVPLHVSYGGSGEFREALVVYRSVESG